ncbi:MAG: sulfurtransferase complex subunit TusB [Pseudomonadales bacterium]
MTLHICNKSPTESSALQSCLAVACSGSGNAVLLIEDAVYAALPALEKSLDLRDEIANTELYALKDDLKARGLESSLASYITAIDYADFVQLCVDHSNSHSWY